jgi:hypothetical protein
LQLCIRPQPNLFTGHCASAHLSAERPKLALSQPTREISTLLGPANFASQPKASLPRYTSQPESECVSDKTKLSASAQWVSAGAAAALGIKHTDRRVGHSIFVTSALTRARLDVSIPHSTHAEYNNDNSGVWLARVCSAGTYLFNPIRVIDAAIHLRWQIARRPPTKAAGRGF